MIPVESILNTHRTTSRSPDDFLISSKRVFIENEQRQSRLLLCLCSLKIWIFFLDPSRIG